MLVELIDMIPGPIYLLITIVALYIPTIYAMKVNHKDLGIIFLINTIYVIWYVSPLYTQILYVIMWLILYIYAMKDLKQ